MVGIRKWIRRTLVPDGKEKRQQQQNSTRDHLPYLPMQYQPLLIPSSSSQDTVNLSRLLHNYGLFGRLPYELRHQILVEAFGGRTIHIDLVYDHPLVRNPQAADMSLAERRTHCGLGSELVPDLTKRKVWQWFGCVCHRRTGYTESEEEHRYAAGKFSRTIEPCDDRCLEGLMCNCEQHAYVCFVGVMGWLLTCQQAYIDGVEILYGTSTFHLSSLDLLLNLQRLLPRHHLDRIKSLELLWKLSVISSGDEASEDTIKSLWDDPTKQDSTLHTICDLLPETFPNLRKIYISFQCWLSSGSYKGYDADRISEMETIFLGPVEHMLRAFGPQKGKEFSVAIQRGGWYVLFVKYHTLLGSKLRVESVDGLSRGRFWKSLSPSGDSGCIDGDKYKEADDFGYWICGGWEDMENFGNDYWLMANWGDKWTGVKETF